MQALTPCDAKVVSTRTAAGQFKGQFKGAMEELSGKVQKASSKSKRRVMDECHRGFKKAKRVQKGKHSAPKLQILL